MAVTCYSVNTNGTGEPGILPSRLVYVAAPSGIDAVVHTARDRIACRYGQRLDATSPFSPRIHLGPSIAQQNPRDRVDPVLTFEVVRARQPEGLSHYLRAVDRQWLFRVSPHRDPNQVRFWCLLVEPVGTPSVTASHIATSTLVVSFGMTRTAMLAELERIRDEPMTWLEEPDRAELWAWMSRVSDLPLPEPRVAGAAPVRRPAVPAPLEQPAPGQTPG